MIQIKNFLLLDKALNYEYIKSKDLSMAKLFMIVSCLL